LTAAAAYLSRLEAAMRSRTPAFTAGVPDVDFTDPHFFASGRHLEVWREARRIHPIAWTGSETDGFWSVTGHRLGSQVIKQPEVFTSKHGMRLGSSPASVRAAANRMLVVSDGARHRALRAAHSSWFASRALAALRPSLQQRLDEHLRQLLDRNAPFDVVRELAMQIPAWILFEMMGVPAEDWERLTRMTAAAFDDDDRSDAATAARTAAHTGIFVYFYGLLKRRRAEPGDDMVSALAAATVDGRSLTDEEVVLNCGGLMNGGLETTPHAVTGAIMAFAENAEQWQRLRNEPVLIDTAIEEILRYTCPPMHAMRTALVDTSIGDTHIAAGDRVVVWLPSCNRDEEVFTEPDRFVIDRRRNPHLSFGGGPHYCIGSTLARMELRCLLESMSRLVAAFELSGEVVPQPSNFLHGLKRLEATFVPAARDL